jgi:hypothetical protein
MTKQPRLHFILSILQQRGKHDNILKGRIPGAELLVGRVQGNEVAFVPAIGGRNGIGEGLVGEGADVAVKISGELRKWSAL